MPRLKLDTIRGRLLMSYVLMTLVTAISIGIGAVLVSYFAGRQQAIERLESVGARKELAIRDWIRSLQQELVIASNTEGEFERISVVLDLARDNQYYVFYNKAVRNRLSGFVHQSPLLKEILLLDLRGQVVLSTDMASEGATLADQMFFQRGLTSTYAQLPFGGGQQLDGDAVVVVIPIVANDGSPLGVMAGRAAAETLADVLVERTGLSKTGKAYLLNADHAILAERSLTVAHDATPQFLGSGADLAIRQQANLSGLYRDERGVRVVGAYRWLADLGILLATEQDLSEAFRAVSLTVGINLAITLAAVLLAAGASLLMARSIATPLVNLAGTAARIANGDLTQMARIERPDEIGILARALNSMTAQLRDLIGTLEKRVAERTDALQQRALQLETSARVSREITSILDIDTLIAQVVNLIRDAFGYYRVHVFLLDQDANQLVLRARSGATQLQFQRLEVDRTSLNTRALQTGAAQVVNDVAQDPYYLADGELPDTRSELVVPLRLGDRLIGTLDVSSTAVNAFTPQDVLVIQSLGDQIAIAIENARLYDRSRALAVIEERTRLARELHDSVTQSLYSVMLLAEGWRRMASAGSRIYVEDYLTRIGEITGQALKEMRLLIHELRPPILERDGLVEALRQRLDAVEKRAGVEARFLMDDLIELPPLVEVGLYRIAQEALNNALKHAAATEVTVRMCVEDGAVVLDVVDNGRGFALPKAAQSGGMGLVSMQERARQLDGVLRITSTPGQGTTISARVPLAVIRPIPTHGQDR